MVRIPCRPEWGLKKQFHTPLTRDKVISWNIAKIKWLSLKYYLDLLGFWHPARWATKERQWVEGIGMWLVSVWCLATPRTEVHHFPLHLHRLCHLLPRLHLHHHCPRHCLPHCHRHCHQSLLIPLSPLLLLLLPPFPPSERIKDIDMVYTPHVL